MLNKTTCLAQVVDSGLDCGQWIQRMLGPNGDDVLIGREAVGHLCPYNCVGQGAHSMVVGRVQSVTLVIPISLKGKKVKSYCEA